MGGVCLLVSSSPSFLRLSPTANSASQTTKPPEPLPSHELTDILKLVSQGLITQQQAALEISKLIMKTYTAAGPNMAGVGETYGVPISAAPDQSTNIKTPSLDTQSEVIYETTDPSFYGPVSASGAPEVWRGAAWLKIQY